VLDTDAVYACAYCGRAAPALNDRALLDWEGGEALYLSEDPQLPPESLVCPDCRVEARERDSVEAD
jgi:hypothetical protein